MAAYAAETGLLVSAFEDATTARWPSPRSIHRGSSDREAYTIAITWTCHIRCQVSSEVNVDVFAPMPALCTQTST